MDDIERLNAWAHRINATGSHCRHQNRLNVCIWYMLRTCVPSTTICGNWIESEPTVLNTSCNLFTTGINASIFGMIFFSLLFVLSQLFSYLILGEFVALFLLEIQLKQQKYRATEYRNKIKQLKHLELANTVDVCGVYRNFCFFPHRELCLKQFFAHSAAVILHTCSIAR